MIPHGTRSRYATGCDCADCRKANAIYHRENRRRFGSDRRNEAGPLLPKRTAWVTTDPRPLKSTEPEWMTDAACRDYDQAIFFPERGEDPRPGRRVCWDECPVRTQCLTYAVANGEFYGIWGGYSARERRLMRQKRSA